MCPFKKAFPFVVLLHLLVVVGIAGAFAHNASQARKGYVFELQAVSGQGELLKAGEDAPRCPLRPEEIKANLKKLAHYIEEHSATTAPAPKENLTKPEPLKETAQVVEQPTAVDKPAGSIAAATHNPRAFVGSAMKKTDGRELLSAPVALFQPKPRHFGAKGEVAVTFTITEAGEVDALRFESDCDADLAKAVERAVSRWRFSPAKRAGAPVSLRVRQVIEF